MFIICNLLDKTVKSVNVCETLMMPRLISMGTLPDLNATKLLTKLPHILLHPAKRALTKK